ncbi:WASH complex subunit 5 isoform X2 [Orussus abietinus]|uniref:WASH complex subunit 5 isoform X2 n=1 Tax=Orussus abietinus TaxID=222816 RepID=UPI0006268280|nr:WASH complex subunit 5 isoform X2 [Orussus abietinus]
MRMDSKLFEQKYGSIILDFIYFNATDQYEQKIDNDPILQEVDEELRDSYSDVLSRFYSAFENIYKYISELNNYINELEAGFYIQQTVESVMLNEEGKQLMCEAVYLYGTMLLVTDLYFEGYIRERLLVSHYRYNVQNSSSTRLDDVCVLLRSTGFSQVQAKRPSNYPEAYFMRIPIKNSLIELIIERLRCDELYNQNLAFPLPEHRSTALANQASMLVVALAFAPNILHNQTALMREVVDRFFPNSWVISVYMGIVINLLDWWFPYKAARSALDNTLETSNVKKHAQKYGVKMKDLITEISDKQISVLMDEIAVEALVKLIRDCNVTLHWILLHVATPSGLSIPSKRSRKLQQLVLQESKYIPRECLQLLLGTAQIEHDVKQICKQLFEDKESSWLKNKQVCVERIGELAETFSGERNIDCIEKNQCLQVWFREIATHIDSLQQEDGKKIVQLLQALEEVQEFHQLENNSHILQYLADTREILRNMLRSSTVTEDIMIVLNIVTDCCYAWNILDSFVDVMQESIKEHPPIVIKLKALFSKMASALEMPLLRINQSHSADLSSVSQYYSRELEAFARRVLQIIPATVFGLLADIITLETNTFKEIPSKLSKEKMKDFAQLDGRLKVAKLTYNISVFTKGLLSLQSVPLGVLRVDSQRLLEDGVRQELIKRVTTALHCGLVFDTRTKTDLVKKLETLAGIMDGYRRSFHYIQDYININSLKIWHEEMIYIINHAVERECKGSTWIPRKVGGFFQDEQTYTSAQGLGSTFMGRVLQELIRITDPRCTIYMEHALVWYDFKTQNEVVNHSTFSTILRAIGPPGLYGIDKMLCFLIVTELTTLVNSIKVESRSKSWQEVLDECNSFFDNERLTKDDLGKLQMMANQYVSKIWPSVLDKIQKIGHLQLLRKRITKELNILCRFEAKHMEAALRTFTEKILSEMSNRTEESIGSRQEAETLFQLCGRVDRTGIEDTQCQIYIKAKSMRSVASIMFLVTISQLSKLYYSKTLATLLSKRNQDPLDTAVFIMGLRTILVQFHDSVFRHYAVLLCEYIVTAVTIDSGRLTNDLEADGGSMLHFLEAFARCSAESKTLIHSNIPNIILDQFSVKFDK